MKLSVITRPTIEPITLIEARSHLKVNTFASDGDIALCIMAARQYIENRLGMVLATTAMRGTLDEFPPRPIAIPVYPVQSITAIRHYDSTGTLVTWAGGDWVSDLTGIMPRVAPTSGVWPATANRIGAIEVDFIAGFAESEPVPFDITQAMRLLVGWYFDNREAVNVGNIVTPLPLGVDSLLASHRGFA